MSERISVAELADCIEVARQEAESFAAHGHGRTRIKADTLAALHELADLREQVRCRPIESAPTDGTKMLLRWRTVPYLLSGRYVVDDEWTLRPKDWLAPEEGWRNDGDQCIPRNQSDCTHWMPLPEISPLPGGDA